MSDELQAVCELKSRSSSKKSSRESSRSWFGNVFSALCCRRMYSEFHNEEIIESNPELENDLKDLFKWLDDYNKGYVDCIDFRRLLRDFGQYELFDRTKRDMKSISRSRYGNMGYKTFSRVMMQTETDETFDKVFRFVDKSNKGYIDENDLQILFKELHLKVDEEHIEELLKDASKSSNMRVDKFEFLDVVK